VSYSHARLRTARGPRLRRLMGELRPSSGAHLVSRRRLYHRRRCIDARLGLPIEHELEVVRPILDCLEVDPRHQMMVDLASSEVVRAGVRGFTSMLSLPRSSNVGATSATSRWHPRSKSAGSPTRRTATSNTMSAGSDGTMTESIWAPTSVSSPSFRGCTCSQGIAQAMRRAVSPYGRLASQVPRTLCRS
jgi:hypothetical protein